MLVAKALKKSYGSLQVLKGINLEIKEKEVVSIVGDSGAGKSTLLHILGTLDKSDQGELLIKGDDISKYDLKKLAAFRNRNVGFVFQFHNLLPEFTAFENICMPGYIGKRKTQEVQDRANELLKILGIESRKDHKPSELSGGEQQRVSVARALINSPLLVFADEPTGNLDSRNAKEMHELFFKLREDLGQTFVVVTHNIDLANMADRKLTISDGVIQ